MSLEQLADQLAARVRERVLVWSRAVIAFDGFGCCGKSTLAQAVAARTGGVILETDDFHQPEDGLIEASSPLSYRRWSALQRAAIALTRGRPARFAPIDWDTKRLAAEVELQPAAVVVLDGIGSHALTLPLQPLRVFVDGRAVTRMQRVARRDGPEHANWDHYVAIERAYFERFRPWRTADLYVLGAELDFCNSAEGFARQLQAACIVTTRLDQPYRGEDQAGNTPVDR
ncbi:MAG: uridine kinase [Betaproteobacteria bacterium]